MKRLDIFKQGKDGVSYLPVIVVVIVVLAIAGVGIYLALKNGPKAEFEVTSLTLSPAEAKVGQTVTVSVVVKNTGDSAGAHKVVLTIDGGEVGAEEVTLAPGETKTVTFTIMKDTEGTFTIGAGGLTKSLNVNPLTPATFEVSNLVLNPSEVEVGNPVVISATVKNVGDLEGTYTVDLKIDGVVQETKEITLAGDASKTISFTITQNIPRTYTIGINGLQRLLNVLERVPKATVTLGDVKVEDLQTWGRTYIKATIRGDEADYSLELDCPIGNRVNSSASYVTKDEMSDGYHSIWLLMSDFYQAPKGGKYTLTVTDDKGNLVDKDEITFSGSNLVASDFVFTFSEFDEYSDRLEEASFTLKNTGDLPAFVGTELPYAIFPETASLASPPQKIKMSFSPWKFALYPGELKRVSEQTNWGVKKGTYTVLVEVYEGMFYFRGDEKIDERKLIMTTTTTVEVP